jgi:hypothetical protein
VRPEVTALVLAGARGLERMGLRGPHKLRNHLGQDGVAGLGQEGRVWWAKLGRDGPEDWVENEKGCRRNPFEFLNKVLDSKIKGFKYF